MRNPSALSATLSQLPVYPVGQVVVRPATTHGCEEYTHSQQVCSPPCGYMWLTWACHKQLKTGLPSSDVKVPPSHEQRRWGASSVFGIGVLGCAIAGNLLSQVLAGGGVLSCAPASTPAAFGEPVTYHALNPILHCLLHTLVRQA